MDVNEVLTQLKQQRQQLEGAISALEGLQSGGQMKPRRGRPPKVAQATASPQTVGRRTMSTGARAKIAAAQRARWAKQKGQSPSKQIASAPKKTSSRKGMSPAARKRLSALMKARWAASKKQS